MSREKDLHEAKRWLETPREDLMAAEVMLDKGFFALMFFGLAGSGEGRQSTLVLHGRKSKGHSIQRSYPGWSGLGQKRGFFFSSNGGVPSDRYHNTNEISLRASGSEPSDYYFQKEADQAIGAARRIWDEVSNIVAGARQKVWRA